MVAMDKQRDGVGALIEAKNLDFFEKAILIKNKVAETKPLIRLTPKHNIDDLSSGVIRIIHKQNGTSNSSVEWIGAKLASISSRYYTGSGGQGMLTIRAASSGLQNERLRLFHVDGGVHHWAHFFQLMHKNESINSGKNIWQ